MENIESQKVSSYLVSHHTETIMHPLSELFLLCWHGTDRRENGITGSKHFFCELLQILPYWPVNVVMEKSKLSLIILPSHVTYLFWLGDCLALLLQSFLHTYSATKDSAPFKTRNFPSCVVTVLSQGVGTISGSGKTSLQGITQACSAHISVSPGLSLRFPWWF